MPCINKEAFRQKRTKGERAVSKVLDSMGVYYLYDMHVSDLTGVLGGPLKFDFCIPLDQNSFSVRDFLRGDSKEYVVLEYNGIFHYHVICGCTNLETLHKQQMNDFVKHSFCRANGVEVLWLPYWEGAIDLDHAVRSFVRNRLLSKGSDESSSSETTAS